MIIEQKCAVIVMLCDCAELGEVSTGWIPDPRHAAALALMHESVIIVLTYVLVNIALIMHNKIVSV